MYIEKRLSGQEEQYTLSFYRAMLSSMQAPVKKSICGAEVKSRTEFFRSWPFSGRGTAVFQKAVFVSERVLHKEKIGLPERETDSGQSLLLLSSE